MPIKVRYHKLHLQIPDRTINVCIGIDQIKHFTDDYPQDLNYIREIEVGNVYGSFGVHECGTMFIFLPEEYNPVTTAHECIHAATQVWENAGARLTPDNDEVVAYTHDAIHNMIRNLYNEPTE